MAAADIPVVLSQNESVENRIPGEETRRKRDREAGSLRRAVEEIRAPRETSKEMREERGGRGERQVRKEGPGRGEEGRGAGAEGNLLNVATKWNGN